MPPAKLQAKAFFLTYSQSALSKEGIYQAVEALGRINRLVVGHEHHKDGNTHFHVVVEYVATKNVSTSHFDLQGEHPNIEMWSRAGGSTYDVWLLNHWRYCHKEDQDPLKRGDEPSPTRKRSRDEMVAECVEVARSDGVPEAQKRALELFASDYCKGVNGYDKIFVRVSNAKSVNPARSVTDFTNAPLVPDNWRAIFIHGPTGHGKTQFARALLPNATVIRHRDQLKNCDFSKGIILDDFAVSHWPPTAIIALMDWDEPSGIDVKHDHVVLPQGTRKIVCFNGDLRKWCGAPSENIGEPSRGPVYGYGDKEKVVFKHREEMTEEQYQAVRRRFTSVIRTTCPLFEGATLSTDPPRQWGDGEEYSE